MIKMTLLFLMAYLLGSVQVSFLLVKGIYGRDIRKIGNQNIGAMNVANNVSLGFGLLTVLLDVLKGVLVILLAKYWIGTVFAIVLASVLVIVGDVWPVFLNFKGGKGIATTIGALLAIKWGIAFWVLLLLGIVVLISRDSNLAVIISFATLPFLTWWGLGSFGWFFFGVVLAVPVLSQHLSIPKITSSMRYLSH